MKENNFYSDDFEELIRGKTEQYKMYPSENVWKGVHSALHTKRKWFIGSMAFLVTGILFMAGRELIIPSNHNVALHKTVSSAGTIADASKSTLTDITPRAPLAVIRPVSSATLSRHAASDNGAIPEELDPATTGISITLSHPVLSQSDLSDWLSHVVQLPAQAPDLGVIAARTMVADDNTVAAGTSARGTTADDQRVAADDQTRGVVESLTDKAAHGNQYAHTGAGLETSQTNRNTINTKSRLTESAGAATASATRIAEANDAQRTNWLHDYAMNILETTPKSGRSYLELALAPTINYRTLGGNDVGAEKLYAPNSGYPPAGGPNDYVSHSPAVGFEFSGSFLYRLTRNLSVKGGLQFNYTRFPITAYASDRPLPNTAALQSSLGYAMDSITARNTSGSFTRRNAVTVYNDYYQLSAPIGFELRVLGNERLQFNLAGTIAPSYLLTSNSYMLNSGYTRFDKQPEMYRKLNLYAGGEAFLSYRVGNIRWQIGPEFRYQLLSSYISSSTISENVKSYGFKIGITKSLP
jgi:hypothetical protein